MREALASVENVGFVPTMGALHKGHLSLMRESKKDGFFTVISIFVNPTQFGPNEDLSKYPRQEAADLKLAEEAGVDLAFLPSVEEMYGGTVTTVTVGGPSQNWEGAQRPGHFSGVATVVLKLFNIVEADCAYFGLKDLQQCAVIRQMCRDIDLKIQLKFIETVRDSDGLALSSRNKYLNAEQREAVQVFPRELQSTAALIRQSGLRSEHLPNLRNNLENAGFVVDYAVCVDPYDMKEVETITGSTRLMAAIRFAGIRLLDNWPIK